MDTPKSPTRDNPSHSPVTPSPSKINRSTLFKRPKWKEEKLKAEQEVKVDGVDIFRRADDTSRVLKQRELEKKERKERKAERRKSREINIDNAAAPMTPDRESKRRRISSETAAEDRPPTLSPDAIRLTASPVQSKAESSAEIIDLETLQTPERKAQILLRQPTEPVGVAEAQDVIDLSDHASPTQPNGNSALNSGEGGDMDEDADDDYREMAAAARRRANGQRSAEAPNPILNILVTPAIEGMLPLVVKLRFLQPFKKVRQEWCKHNIESGRLDPSAEPDVILKWRERKVYDVQTCKSLGVTLDEDGQPMLMDKYGVPEVCDKVNMTATTKQAESEERQSRLVRVAPAPEEPASSPVRSAERAFRLILRSKDYPEQKFLIKESSTVGKLVYAFKQQARVPEDKRIIITFDGEALDVESMMKETEIAECDDDTVTLDVHVK